ncbi:YkvA family protein [Actinoplanes sp. NPDC023801]|uniref:YkvA family protein n=1 Tax=Actinoplanes sp. NPDC023801 TaxID=3154595 RepID=UPI0033EEC680
MDTVWKIAAGAGLGLVVVWLVLIVALLMAGRRYDRPGLGEMLRLLPDLLRLLKRLAGDAGLPRGVRVRLWLLLAYLAVPIDLIPDFIPVIGYADDAIIVALTLRSVARRAGSSALHRHWPGSPAGLAAVLRTAGVRTDGDAAPQT